MNIETTDGQQSSSLFKRLDHVAIVVAETEVALQFYRDTMGLNVLFSEVLEEQSVRLTHLDLGNCQLQLVQPLTEDHPLREILQKQGESIYHICFLVDNVPEAMAALPQHQMLSRDAKPRRGPNGRQAAFIDPSTTRSVLLEVSAPPRLPEQERKSTI